MAHLLAPQPPHPELPVFFNVDGVVGAPPAQNMREDVLLVQFAFKVFADSPGSTKDLGLLAAAKAVRVTGTIDTETINAIRVLQQTYEGVVDGRVSPARGTYSYGTSYWSIALLNDAMQDRNVDIWPRIDKIPGCPGELKQMVIRTVVGRGKSR